MSDKTRACRVFKSGPASRAWIANTLLAAGQNVVFLVRSSAEAAELRGLLRLFSPPRSLAMWDRPWTILPDFPLVQMADDPRAWPRRMAGLFSLAEGRRPRGLVATIDNLLGRWLPRDFFVNRHINLNRGEEISSEMVLEQATAWGYERVALVTRPGEMAMRGDILDIFTPGYDTALRLEFFGDTLEDLRLFDPVSQRSKANLDDATLLPVAPAAFDEAGKDALRARWKVWRQAGRIPRELERSLLRRLDKGDGRIPAGLAYERPSRLEEWFPPDPILLVSAQAAPDPLSALASAMDEELWTLDSLLEEETDDAERPSLASVKSLLRRDRDEVLESLTARRMLSFEELTLGMDKDGVDLPERVIDSFDALIGQNRELLEQEAGEAGSAFSSAKDRPWHTLVRLLKDWRRSKRQTILSFHSESGRRKFLKLAEPEGLEPTLEYTPSGQGLFALVSPLQKGFDLAWRQTLILAEDQLQPSGARPPVKDKAFKGLAAYDELTPGMLLVHRDYGLGRFGGLERLDVKDAGNDYLLVYFAGDDKLYLPVDRLSLIQRYKGPEGSEPPLDKLGGATWVKTRERARKAVEQIAADLVEMYAYRRIAKGYGYSPLNELYREFEASFGFEETPDQARAIQEVLEEMERPEPMDRLVCGDVGFGKTEVAMRAAFRAAMDGRQVAILCPTTVLAEQHYQNFRSRFQGFPINVGMLSRFVSPKKQKQVAEAAKRGQVDILIGTHRLLSKDVGLPNLGLLVLDEEQRFGVRHKEKLKQLKKNIDVLTLTATPIPRTLQLSLSGIRSLSVIETPPRDRKPVETALIERDGPLLSTILKREIEREGQVFWVHNRVQGLERVAEYVKKLAPGARVAMAHGQMPEKQLEEAMHAFWHGELDVLVCTAIVESGLDFPRANTLVVDQAQMFGLGQLYQLRGRVGRSDRQAYAYFVVNDVQNMPEMARERLKIILDMEYLGAGFQIAMEDLRLRGAGNILGESQSGQIARIGLDLFLEMLEDEVRRLHGEPLYEEVETELNIGFLANIPESYIADSRERLKYYKGFTSLRSADARADLESEVRDRFGPMPEELSTFLDVLELKRILSSLQVAKADLRPQVLSLSFAEHAVAVAPERLVAWMQPRAGWAKLKPPATLELRPAGETIRERLQRAGRELLSLTPQHVAQTKEGAVRATDKRA